MKINYVLPNNTKVELISDMHIQCFDFGPFDTPIEELLKEYSQTEGEQRNAIHLLICRQCDFYAEVIGYDEEIANNISFDNFASDIEHTLLQAVNQQS